ncbi:PREDICTED: SPX domain-containing protein 2-like isoform X3 [Camelina sativa]|uniref:SPX domain-containing protein 2-like isoform X1 n=1 Tax=Camelina sativa TaxID=90675 RepID=A0ABM1QA02_CAMSA|nr:PREDICTED: SPX domain-containing protein 2-like isoform X1 [Camelina sativa]XP_019083591.1 PREDICTED: SPX domain-containing protein 2-like isoform X2 [Camelina sativa]XP_019083592.1 PREDICTED: SPX domain-containing protein 2-like isoform X3 [Camelina sativa]
MKFGKSLSNQIEETLPEWRDKFLSYKELKKKLKLMEPRSVDNRRPSKRSRSDSNSNSVDSDPTAGMTKEELDFISLLEDELEKFNSFFVEQEEEYIIRLKELKDQVAKAKNSNEEMINIKKEIVDFHGEMVLLMNYSALNYTGLAKILKKYDKRTGALIRLPFIQKVLQEPFFTTDLLNTFVKECEAMLDHLFPSNKIRNLEEGEPTTSGTVQTATDDSDLLRVPKELSEIEYMESLYMKSTVSALKVLKEIRSGSSTVSAFSLPPLQASGLEDDSWKKKVGVLEQVAK